MYKILRILPHNFSNLHKISTRHLNTSRVINGQLINPKPTNENAVSLPEWLVGNEKSLEFSLNILKDSSLYINKVESSKFLTPEPKSDALPITNWIYNNLIKSKKFKHIAITMNILSLGQVENQSLAISLNIGPGFNMKLYFYTIHLWILHRRLIQIRPYGQILDSELFEICWDVISKWVVKKQAKSYLVKELQHVKHAVQLFCFDLDVASQSKSLIPTKLAQTLYKHMYIDQNVDKVALTKFVKYIIRQFLHIQNVETNHFMDARFTWANYDEIYRHPRVFAQATPSILKYDGYNPRDTQLITK